MSREKTEAAQYRAFPIRIPVPLLEWVREEAAEGRRPVNTQIMMFIEEALERKAAAEAAAPRRRMATAR